MADENPIFRDLLDSLASFDQRLTLIESALSIPTADSFAVSTPVKPAAAGPATCAASAPFSTPNINPPPYSGGLCAPSSLASVAINHEAHSDKDENGDNGDDEYVGDIDGDDDGQNEDEDEDKRTAVKRNAYAIEARATDEPYYQAAAISPTASAAQPKGSGSNAASGSSQLEALPEGFVVTARATLQDELDGWTIPRGYSMRINGTRSHGRRQKIRMVCFRGGRSRLRPKASTGAAEMVGGTSAGTVADEGVGTVRKPVADRVSKKCECPFRFELVEVEPGAGRYAVHYTNDGHRWHNHAAADLLLDPRARKLPRALKAEVDRWLTGDAGLDSTGDDISNGNDNDIDRAEIRAFAPWSIAKIQAELQRRGYGHVLDFDLRNRKRALLNKARVAERVRGQQQQQQ